MSLIVVDVYLHYITLHLASVLANSPSLNTYTSSTLSIHVHVDLADLAELHE